MSKLAVGQLEGLASEGYKISVASGSQLVQAGAILQVVSTTKTDTFTFSTSNTWTDITGLSVAVTPSATSSKVFVQAMISGVFFRTTQNAVFLRVARDSTPIAIGDAASTRPRVTTSQVTPTSLGTDSPSSIHISFLDSPSTTSSITYKIQVIQDSPASPMYVNRSVVDNDGTNGGRGVSTITVMEVAG